MKTDLIYDKFKQYEVVEDRNWFTSLFGEDHFEHRFRFENDYGASVIKHYGSYGFEQDLFELAVTKYDNSVNWHLCYDTEITDYVIGYLTNEKVLELLHKIKNLKKEEGK